MGSGNWIVDNLNSALAMWNGRLAEKTLPRTSPGTMEQLTLSAEQVAGLSGPVTVSAEHGEVMA